MPQPTRDEIDVDVGTVCALLRDQLPELARLPLEPVRLRGTDHAMFRLGEDLAVRLPRVAWAVPTLLREQEWLPRIAGALPARIPLPVALGEPGHGYPWPWSVCHWVPGANPVPDELSDPEALAADLAGFARSMRGLDPTGAPPTVWPAPLHEEDARVASLLPAVAHLVDAEPIEQAWAVALAARPCATRTWIHGDLAPGNLLVDRDRLVGVIDFSAMGLGDPASDLRPAWNLLPQAARDALRDEVGADADEWARARGWVLLQALAQLSLFQDRLPALAGNARLVLAQIAQEVRTGRM